MSKIARLAALVGVLLGVSILVVVLTTDPDAKGPTLPGTGGLSAEGRAVDVLTDSQSCAPCHQQIYEEWKASWHGQAWTEPEVRLLSENFKNKDCIPCHAPRPLWETGLGERVLPRLERRPEGVDCLACHAHQNGMVGPRGAIGTRRTWPDACDPIARPEFISSMQLCFPCHNQHKTHDEWNASEFGQAGTDCNDCHMPTVPGPATIGSNKQQHRSHAFRGGHDPDYIRQAIPFSASVERDESGRRVGVITIENRGAGHNFPTDSRNRAADIVYSVLNEGGIEVEGGEVFRMRNPYVTELDKDNTQLASGEKKTFRVDLPIDAGTFVARLYYRHNPFEEDEDSVLLFEERVAYR